jgi:hypothetical protein
MDRASDAKQDQSAYQARVVGGQGSCDPTSEAMPQHDDGTGDELLNRRGEIRREIVVGEAVERPSTALNTPGLR